MKLSVNKRLLFSLMGAGGGAVGALAAQLVFSGEGTFWGNITSTSLWSGCASAFIAFFMAWAGEIYHRKSGFPKEIIWPSLRSGAIAGAISGAGAQAIYSVYTFGSPLLQLAFQASCWSIMGALLGWGFARFMPNMRKNKACIGGGIGGFIGGLIFVVVTIFVPEVIGHIIGFAIMGASLGLSLVVAEALFRRAAIEIVWAPNEITTVTLGKDPVYLGGGDDHVYIAGLPQHAISVVIENGIILCRQQGVAQSVTLRNGSQINVGRVHAVIRATK